MNKTSQSKEYLSEQNIHVEWESDYLNPDIDRFYDAAFGKIIERLGAQPGDRILDAGCGYCFHASRLARAGLDVTGVDFSPPALLAAQENIAEQGLSIDLHEGNILDLPFPNASFPFVSCWGVLMHIPDLERALEQLIRVLKPNGRLAISENNSKSLHVKYWENIILRTKRLVGRSAPRRDHTERGIEEWREEGLMVRKIDIDWLTEFCAQRGLICKDRFAGQFTELYTNMPCKPLKRAVYRFNEQWFDKEKSSDLALGNILIFEKAG